MNTQENLARYRSLIQEDWASKGWSLKDVLLQWSEIKDSIDEYFALLYIEYTKDTQDEQKAKDYTQGIEDMELFSPLHHQIEKKILENYKQPEAYFQYAYKLLHNSVSLFREDNIPLETKEGKLSQEYQAFVGALTIEHDGKNIPLAMAKPLLESIDRDLRSATFTKICQAQASVAQPIDEIFQKQLEIRNTIATNAGFSNYRDYTHQAKARFDYTPEDCLTFSDSILKEIVPISSTLHTQRRKNLGLSTLAPFDMGVDPFGEAPLKPAMNPQDFLNKSIEVLTHVGQDVGNTLIHLNKNGKLDLFSRQGKAPGGYNYPLPLSKTSFIFMNCAFVHQDVVTLFHEAGHAYHFDLYKNHLDPFLYKSPSSEIAELASMSMELMSMEHWHLLYPNEKDLRRAKKRQLEGIIQFFPWMAIVDSFQHWVYLHPQSSVTERNAHFVHLYKQFLPEIHWENLDIYLPTQWHRQLHIVELPFYYIEYGIAQLGAIQIWKWYKEDPKEGLHRYQEALSYASQGPISEAYKKAGVSVAFTPEYIRPLLQFLQKELQEFL